MSFHYVDPQLSNRRPHKTIGPNKNIVVSSDATDQYQNTLTQFFFFFFWLEFLNNKKIPYQPTKKNSHEVSGNDNTFC